MAAVLDVLQSGQVLKELNNTLITLIPKARCPQNVSEYRPVSCCIGDEMCNHSNVFFDDQ